MNYLYLINNFWIKDLEYNFTDKETAFYFYLLKTANAQAWKNPFQLSNAMVCAKFRWGKSSVNTIKNRLQQAGLIVVQAGTGRGHPNLYQITSTKTTIEPVRTNPAKKREIPTSENIGYCFDTFWTLYDKKVGNIEKLTDKWNRLPLDDKQAIVAYIPQYIKNQPNKQFRKNPETFLNNRGWEDELIISHNDNRFTSMLATDISKF